MTETRSTKRNRVYVHRFDHDLAATLRAGGMTWAAISRELGVTVAAVRMAVDPRARERNKRNAQRNQRSGVCLACGGPMSRNGSDAANPNVKRTYTRCVTCYRTGREVPA